jgi:CelD/BcsL family acetyltransferase involved in cellulose biosynthesis
MQFICYTDFPEDLEIQWDELLAESVTNVPFLKFSYLKGWWQTRGGGEWPENAHLAIVIAKENKKLIGIAPLFISIHEQKTTVYLLGSKEVCDYLDVIVHPDNLDLFIFELITFINSDAFPDWDQIIFHNIVENSPTVKALESAAKSLQWNFRTECVKHSPFVSLPGDWDAYLALIDKKQRHEIRRKMRRAAESSEVKWYFVEKRDSLENEINDFLGLMALDGEKAHFLNDPMKEFMRFSLNWAFQEHCLQLSFLEIQGHKAAGYFCFDYQNRILVYNSGFDPDYSEYSPGWVLLGNLLQWANENHRSEFDFMRGNEDYKYRFGGKDRFVICAIINRGG